LVQPLIIFLRMRVLPQELPICLVGLSQKGDGAGRLINGEIIHRVKKEGQIFVLELLENMGKSLKSSPPIAYLDDIQYRNFPGETFRVLKEAVKRMNIEYRIKKA